MPIYEYECEGCGRVHDKIQKFSDPPMETCPDCGKSVRKLMSLSSFSLKGSGWYTTDYKAKPKSEGAAEKKSTPSSDAPSTGTSTEKTSTATKTESAGTSA